MNKRYLFKGKPINGTETVSGGYYEWDDKSYIIQKDIWDKEPLLAHMIEVEPDTVILENELIVSNEKRRVGYNKNADEFVCSRCGGILYCYPSQPAYCANCGQPLDWGKI